MRTSVDGYKITGPRDAELPSFRQPVAFQLLNYLLALAGGVLAVGKIASAKITYRNVQNRRVGGRLSIVLGIGVRIRYRGKTCEHQTCRPGVGTIGKRDGKPAEGTRLRALALLRLLWTPDNQVDLVSPHAAQRRKHVDTNQAGLVRQEIKLARRITFLYPGGRCRGLSGRKLYRYIELPILFGGDRLIVRIEDRDFHLGPGIQLDSCGKQLSAYLRRLRGNNGNLPADLRLVLLGIPCATAPAAKQVPATIANNTAKVRFVVFREHLNIVAPPYRNSERYRAQRNTFPNKACSERWTYARIPRP